MFRKGPAGPAKYQSARVCTYISSTILLDSAHGNTQTWCKSYWYKAKSQVLSKIGESVKQSKDDEPISLKYVNTVKPVLSRYSKIDKSKILVTNGSLMNVESIAECSKGSILQYF